MSASREKRIEAARRAAEIFEMRTRSVGWQAIADHFHISLATAWKAYERVLLRTPLVVDVRRQKRVELDKLERAEARAWVALDNARLSDVPKAIEALIRILDFRARLLGLYAPTKMAIEDEGDGLTLASLRKLIEMREAADAEEPRQIEATATEVSDNGGREVGRGVPRRGLLVPGSAA